jgi:hypothetical protein
MADTVETKKVYENIDHDMLKEMAKISKRIRRHGDANVVLSRGRKIMTASHKKRTYAIWYNKLKEKKEAEKDRLRSLGIEVKNRGRPRKNKVD